MFCAVLQGVQQLQLRKDSEKQHIQQLEQNAAAQQQMVAALQQEIAQLHQKNADLQARSTAYETSLESVFSSKSWKLTAPIRSLMRLFPPAAASAGPAGVQQHPEHLSAGLRIGPQHGPESHLD